ncbi:MAG: hypothetical protein DWQ47_08860 [Acidobacteria bacterium]|nr:MAG: hypothetical protein DWQ32_16960 [Acidobacteriota bacterium]REJ98986.1 MAG: hypothetical protein DWQ38_13020 [Acidobacteriota bacterium]REK16294.1 MAG: hypothetical protein DWQ43_04670 [Acidobacteriota bacterium]REK43975.1 MAG: hypothetical protein DWQ47_08860 [Acidobacteriota bacterium]
MPKTAAKENIEGIYPLTFIQEAMLMHSLESAADRGALSVRCVLKGQLDRDAFSKAWTATVNRHEALRSSIHWEDIAKPVRVVHKKVDHEVTFEVARNGNGVARPGLVLNDAPVGRLTLTQQSPFEHELIWDCHHILLDGWSAAVIVKDLIAAYESEVNGSDLALPRVPSYREYLRSLSSRPNSEALDFWKEELRGFKTPIVYESERKRSREKGDPVDERFAIDRRESTLLRDLARSNRVTIGAVIHAVWAVALAGASGNKDVCFGSTVSGRMADLEGIEALSGVLMNVVPVRVDLRRFRNTQEFLAGLHRKLASVNRFGHLQLETIIGQKDWKFGRPLFESLLVIENLPVESFTGGGLEVVGFRSGITSTYPLTAAVMPGDELQFTIRSAADLISNEHRQVLRTAILKTASLLSRGTGSIEEILDAIPAYEPPPEDFIEAHEPDPIKVSRTGPLKKGEVELLRIWNELLPQTDFDVEDDFFDIGGTSIQAIRMFALIEERFGKKLPPVTLIGNRSIRELAAYISGSDDEEEWSIVVPLNPEGTKSPLFCVHAGGGHVFFYDPLARHLDREQPVYGLQRLDIDRFEAARQSIEGIASEYLSEIKKVQLSGPYNFVGTCYSNSICYEMARQLLAEGEKIGVLAIVDSAPDGIDRRTAGDKVGRVTGMLKRGDLSFVGTFIKGRFITPARKLWRYAKADEEDREFKRLMGTLNRTAERYDWKPFSGVVTLLMSKSFYENPIRERITDRWNELAGGGLELYEVGGDHRTIFYEPDVEGLAKRLQACLDARSDTEPGVKIPNNGK